MVLYSDNQSIRDRNISVLAIVECAAALVGFWWLYDKYQDQLLFFCGILLAGPLLLLRSNESIEYGRRLYGRNLDAFGRDLKVPWIAQVKSARYWLVIFLTMTVSAAAVVASSKLDKSVAAIFPTSAAGIAWVCSSSLIAWFISGVLAQAFATAALGFVSGAVSGKPAVIGVAFAAFFAVVLSNGLARGSAPASLYAAIVCLGPTIWVSKSSIGMGAAAHTASTAFGRAVLGAQGVRQSWGTILAAPQFILGMFLSSYGIRVVATVRHWKEGWHAMPENYRTALFVTDCVRPAELIPGYSGYGQISSDVLWECVRSGDANAVKRITALVQMLLLWAPVAFYRFALKATFPFYWGLLGIRIVKLRIAEADFDQLMNEFSVNAEKGPIAFAIGYTILVILPDLVAAGLHSGTNWNVLSLLLHVDWSAHSLPAICAYISTAITAFIWYFHGKASVRYEHARACGLSPVEAGYWPVVFWLASWVRTFSSSIVWGVSILGVASDFFPRLGLGHIVSRVTGPIGI